MTPGLLNFIESMRPWLAKGDGGAFRACRDAANDVGVRLRVLRSRSLPVKKSNRPREFGYSPFWRTVGPRIERVGRQDLEFSEPREPATLTFTQLPPFNYGDVVTINDAVWSPDFWDPYETERMFRDLEAERRVVVQVGTPRGFLITNINYDTRSITLTHDVPRITITSEPRAPEPPSKSRVPRHVQQNRPRLDGRRSHHQ